MLRSVSCASLDLLCAHIICLLIAIFSLDALFEITIRGDIKSISDRLG